MGTRKFLQLSQIRCLRNLNALVASLFLLTGITCIYGQSKDEHRMPDWLRAHMEFLARDDGYWVTENSNYKSENEPSDAYSLEWRWGIGKQSLIGRLSGLQDGREIGTFWEYRLVWHPGEKQAILYQFGRDGTFGYGPLHQHDAETNELEQTFFNTDGSSWTGRHHTKDSGDEHHTTSFVLRDGNWEKNRYYVWRRASKKSEP